MADDENYRRVINMPHPIRQAARDALQRDDIHPTAATVDAYLAGYNDARRAAAELVKDQAADGHTGSRCARCGSVKRITSISSNNQFCGDCGTARV